MNRNNQKKYNLVTKCHKSSKHSFIWHLFHVEYTPKITVYDQLFNVIWFSGHYFHDINVAQCRYKSVGIDWLLFRWLAQLIIRMNQLNTLSIQIKFSVCLSVRLSVCVFRSADIIVRGIFNIFSTYGASAQKCFSQSRT